MSDLPRVLLYFMGVDWPAFTRRPLIRALAEAGRRFGLTVVAVNRPLCPVTTLLRKRRRLPELFGRARLEQLESNLFLYSPRYVLHDWIAPRLPGLPSANRAALRCGYRRLLRRLRLDEPRPIVWYNYPQQGYVTRLFEDSFSIFEFYDNLSDIDGRESPAVKRLEEELRPRVDLLLTVSRKMHDRYARHYRRSLLFGNGLERSAFERLAGSDAATLPELEALPSPRIGFAGVISGRLDENLIARLAENTPDFNYVFVGPVADPAFRERLAPHSNIHFLGPYPQETMAAVLSGFDIGIMPYRDTPFFEHSNPLKFYEMAAAGLPMVSSNMEELKQYPEELVRVLPNDPEAWREALHRQLTRDREATRRLGRPVAARFVWDDMASSLLDTLSTEIARRDGRSHGR